MKIKVKACLIIFLAFYMPTKSLLAFVIKDQMRANRVPMRGKVDDVRGSGKLIAVKMSR